MKKLIVFDLDGTLAEGNSSLDGEMVTLLDRLLSIVKVAIISDHDWSQFEKQIFIRRNLPPVKKSPSLMPCRKQVPRRGSGSPRGGEKSSKTGVAKLRSPHGGRMHPSARSGRSILRSGQL